MDLTALHGALLSRRARIRKIAYVSSISTDGLSGKGFRRYGGQLLPDQGKSHEEHEGGEAACREVGAAEPERHGGGGHEERPEGLSEAQDGTVDGDKGAPVF